GRGQATAGRGRPAILPCCSAACCAAVAPSRILRPMPALAVPSLRGAIRRELHFFTLYRVLEAALLCLAVFGPHGDLLGAPRHPVLAVVLAPAYRAAAVLLCFAGRHGSIRDQVLAGIGIDIVASTLAMHAIPAVAPGIAMMLLFNIGATALLLPLRLGLAVAAVACAAQIGEYAWALLEGESEARRLAEALMFGVSYMAIATLTSVVGRQLRASEALAAQRGDQVANLAEVNELIIRRMRTGVLLVDGNGEIRLANEAAMLQLGEAGEGRRLLATAAPQLDARLHKWRREGGDDPTPLQLSPGLPEVLPRFTRLLAEGEQVL